MVMISPSRMNELVALYQAARAAREAHLALTDIALIDLPPIEAVKHDIATEVARRRMDKARDAYERAIGQEIARHHRAMGGL